MYNRYIPQPDGSYRRNRMAEPSPPPISTPTPPPEPECQEPPREVTPPHKPPQMPPMRPPQQNHQPGNAGDFLRQLLPKNLDTGDLLIIVLLLLMSADCQEDRNTALLTLALYLIM